MCTLVNLVSSVLDYYGCEAKHQTMVQADNLLRKDKKHVIVMVFDGMGSSCLRTHLPENSFLRMHWQEDISSVFPPTTTAAITSLESGLTPAEHGWLGWTLHFSEVNKNVAIFPNTCNGKLASQEHLARKYMPYKSVFEQIREAGHADALCISPYGEHKIETLDEGMEVLREKCQSDDKKYLYFYWPEPDYSTHDFGCTSDETGILVREINRKVEALCSELNDTLVLITADHGLTDVTYRNVCYDKDLKKSLKYPPTIESRCASFHVKEGSQQVFPELFRRCMGENFKLLTHQEVLDQKIFGEGIMSERTQEYIGDYLAIATANECIAYRKEHKPFMAAHAGGTLEERQIPFIVIEK